MLYIGILISTFSGCELLNDSTLLEEDDSADIEIGAIVNFPQPGIAYSVAGTITTSSTITKSNISVSIENNNTDVTDTYFTVEMTEFGPKTSIDIKNDLELTITSTLNIPTGNYTLKIMVTVNTTTEDSQINFVINK